MRRVGEAATEALAGLEPNEGWDERERRLAVEAAKAAEAAILRQDDARRRELVVWGLPVKDLERIWAARLSETEAMVAVRESARLARGITVLSGDKGCGKTTAAAWWLMEQGPRSEFLVLQDPLFIPSFRLERSSRYSPEKMDRLELARRLVLDDVGAEYMDAKGHFQSFLDGLVDARYSNCLPLLMTTNLPAAEFKERFGERIADRIREVGRFVEIAEPSMRSKK